MDNLFLGVIDRIEENVATIIIEDIKEELIVPVGKLPIGSEEGTWLNIEKIEHNYTVININEEKTDMMKQQSEQLMNKLKSRKRTSRFKRK